MPVKARIQRFGELILVETEYGQKAVVPADTLCDLIARYKLEIVNEEVRCERIEVGGRKYDFEVDTSED